jgi:hypothetical protein
VRPLGYGLEVSARTDARLLGVDFSVEAIRRAREQARRLGRAAAFCVGDLGAPGLGAGSAGAVLCVDASQFAARQVPPRAPRPGPEENPVDH